MAPTTLLAIAGVTTTARPPGRCRRRRDRCATGICRRAAPARRASARRSTEIGRLLARARAVNTPVIHIVHQGGPGGPFAPGSPGVEIASPATPAPDEPVLTKRLPNAFASTDLADRLHALKRPEIVLVGFMTHMCVEATARAAIDVGLKATVVANATATRDLPDPLSGQAVSAAEVQRNALAALADRFATIVPGVEAIRD